MPLMSPVDHEDQQANKHYIPSEDYQEVFERERTHMGKDPQAPLTGLALSGGGIRSASFGLGVMQAFVKARLMDKFDYLSTVSGGGYIGSSLTWFLQKGAPGIPKTDCSPDGFPFGQPDKGALSDQEVTEEETTSETSFFGSAETVMQKKYINRNGVLNYIRQHGNYLTPGRGLNALSLFASAVRSMGITLVFYMALLTGLMMFGYNTFKGLLDVPAIRQFLESYLQFKDFHLLDVVSRHNFLAWLTVMGLVWLICTYIWHAIKSQFLYSSKKETDPEAIQKNQKISNENYKHYIGSQRRQGYYWTYVIVMGLFASLPYTYDWLYTWSIEMITSGAGLGYLKYLKSSGGDKESGGMLSGLTTYLAIILVLYGLLLGSYSVAVWSWGFEMPLGMSVTGVVLMALSILFGALGNGNIIGHHRMYRDRLMELFMPNRDSLESKSWKPATDANNAYLHEFCREHPRPYHLINTNVILKDSNNPTYRGRGGDSFLLSPLFCGSHATGWRETSTYHHSGRGGFDGISLATAMAASGAALNPHAGVSGEGPTRSFLVSFLLNMLNLRLGVHLPLPEKSNQSMRGFRYKTNLLKTSFAALKGNFTEKEDVVEISDGGHFENLGIYELIRRKLKVIVICDGGADPNYNFDDLTNAIEKVRVDFGVYIKFDDDALQKMIPVEQNDSPLHNKCDIAENGFARAQIYYPNSKDPGILIYVKTTMVPKVPVDVLGYKMANPLFPDQSTGDQFFDEKQFEAYRELGYTIGRQLLESKTSLSSSDSSDSGTTFETQFRNF